ncbi:hypothetical protein ABL78_2470 [Leptomonas seymouri]|uniref:Zeta toxin domain-containing protein n=1 Tax=Leptomonas seymouri TaxID=5684 RepID=A0A0N1I622_LEPSE|nr:hypothetical protein ABL78_2470 [Leptomonas seymouri]|eukprot:KPI88405.1 hypothetical protein ABL78_2470 [Leptomonas seymouri]
MLMPPSTDGALTYLVGLSQLVDSISVINRADGPLEVANTTLYTRYTLHGALLFCGIKQHRVQQTADQMIAQLLPAALSFPQTAAVSGSGPLLLFADSDATQAESYQHILLSRFVNDWLLMSAAHAPSDTPASPNGKHYCHQHLSSRRYQLRVPASAWRRAIIKALGNELRGQMICLRPLLRWNLACAKQEEQLPMVILIGGTSGSGKSTLARLVASQLRIADVLPTDVIRQSLRARLAGRAKDYPTLFVSTYEAYKVAGAASSDARPEEIVKAYESQCELVLRVLDGLLKRLLTRRKSVVVEGVHLLPKYLAAKRAELLVDRVICVPVIVRIPKADGHLERFCVRSRGMSLQSNNNRYIASFQAIRTIQSHLVSTVEEAAMPVLLLTNTNVDKSFLVLHHAVLETMEHTALHGWPATAEATAQVPLTPLAFTATKRRLVAVVRQRRTHRGAEGAVVGERGDGNDSNHSSDGGAAAVRDGQGGTPTEILIGTREGTTLPSAARAASMHRLSLELCSEAGVSQSGFVFPAGADGVVAASSRARSAELLSTELRGLPEQGLHSSTRHKGALHAHAEAKHAQETPCSSSSAPGCSNSAQPDSTTRYTGQSQPSNISAVNRRGSPFRATAPRRSNTTSVLFPSSLGARALSRDGEETFDELEVPSLTGS